MVEIENALKTATMDRDTARQALDKEKTAGDRLRKQLSVVLNDLETAKANLAKANQTITGLKAMKPVEPTSQPEGAVPLPLPVVTPSRETGPPEAPPAVPAPQQTGDPASLPVSRQPPENAPVPVEPDGAVTPTPTPQPPTGDPEPQAGLTMPGADTPIASDGSTPITEETLPDVSLESSTAAPAAD